MQKDEENGETNEESVTGEKESGRSSPASRPRKNETNAITGRVWISTRCSLVELLFSDDNWICNGCIGIYRDVQIDHLDSA